MVSGVTSKGGQSLEVWIFDASVIDVPGIENLEMDETIRENTTAEALSNLKASFLKME